MVCGLCPLSQHRWWILTPDTAARPCWCSSQWCSWASLCSSSTNSRGTHLCDEFHLMHLDRWCLYLLPCRPLLMIPDEHSLDQSIRRVCIFDLTSSLYAVDRLLAGFQCMRLHTAISAKMWGKPPPSFNMQLLCQGCYLLNKLFILKMILLESCREMEKLSLIIDMNFFPLV